MAIGWLETHAPPSPQLRDLAFKMAGGFFTQLLKEATNLPSQYLTTARSGHSLKASDTFADSLADLVGEVCQGRRLALKVLKYTH